MRLSTYVTFSLFLASVQPVTAKDNGYYWDKLQKFKKEVFPVFPCHQAQPKYYQGFPAWTVGASISSGKATSAQYQASSFKNIKDQYFKAGKKRYYFPAYYHEGSAKLGPTGDYEFIGFVSYKVSKVRERYDPEKHGPLTNTVHPQEGGSYWRNRQSGSAVVKPIRYREGRSSGGTYIAYEVCFDPQVHSFEGVNQWPEVQPGERFRYSRDDVPTIHGYRLHINDKIESYVSRLNTLETSLLFVRAIGYFSPINSPFLNIQDFRACKKAGENYCWEQAGVDLASDALFFLKLAKLSKLKKIKTISDRVGDGALVFTAVGNVTLAGLYARDGRSAIEIGGRLFASAGDIATISMKAGKISVAKIKDVQPQCAEINGNGVGKRVDTVPSASKATCEITLAPPELSARYSHSDAEALIEALLNPASLKAKLYDDAAAVINGRAPRQYLDDLRASIGEERTNRLLNRLDEAHSSGIESTRFMDKNDPDIFDAAGYCTEKEICMNPLTSTNPYEFASTLSHEIKHHENQTEKFRKMIGRTGMSKEEFVSENARVMAREEATAQLEGFHMLFEFGHEGKITPSEIVAKKDISILEAVANALNEKRDVLDAATDAVLAHPGYSKQYTERMEAIYDAAICHNLDLGTAQGHPF